MRKRLIQLNCRALEEREARQKESAPPEAARTHVEVVRRRRHLLILLAGEDINPHEVALSVTVLARLGGSNVHHLPIQRAP